MNPCQIPLMLSAGTLRIFVYIQFAVFLVVYVIANNVMALNVFSSAPECHQHSDSTNKFTFMKRNRNIRYSYTVPDTQNISEFTPSSVLPRHHHHQKLHFDTTYCM